MNNDARKKRNTAIFIALATIGNIVLMVIFFILGFLLLGKFGNPEDSSGNMVWLTLIFFASIFLSWFIYSRFVKWYTNRVNAEETFAPLFTRRKGSPKASSDRSKTEKKE